MRLSAPDYMAEPASQIAALQIKVAELKAQLELVRGDRPITIRQMKADIASMIEAELSPPHTYSHTLSRADLIKIHAWIKAKAEA
jgi:hypothetical protein